MAAVVLAMVGLTTVGCQEQEVQAYAPPPPEVAVVTIEPRRVVLTDVLPGRVAPMLVAEVRPQVSGVVQRRLFNEGADVKEGDVLYQLEDAPFRAAVTSAEAQLAAVRKAVDQARADLEATKAEVARQEAVLELALLNKERFETLASDGASSASERDRYVTEAAVAQASLAAAKAEVASDEQALEKAIAAVAQAEAALETARINLDYTQVKAPITGRIGKSNVTVGSLVTAHQAQPLSVIQQLDPIFVDVPQSHGELLKLRQMMENNNLEHDEGVVNRVELILEDGRQYAHSGTLEFRDVTVDTATNSVLVRMMFPNPERVLLPGMFVRAIVTEGINPHGIMVSQQAVSRDTKGEPIVLLVKDDNTVEQRTITLDRAIGNEWLVSSGLNPGDRVIMEGSQRARHGSTVRVVDFQSPKQVAESQTDGDNGGATAR